MRYARAMAGNSSSGIIEAPSFELPVVNIGSRQQSRLMAANVINVPCQSPEIEAGIIKALDPNFKESLKGLINPYGNGQASRKIVEVLKKCKLGPRLLLKKFKNI